MFSKLSSILTPLFSSSSAANSSLRIPATQPAPSGEHTHTCKHTVILSSPVHTISVHTIAWQFIIFTIFTITTFIFSYLFSLSYSTKDLALWKILSSIDLFLSYRTDSMDSRTIWCFCSAQRLNLFAWCVRLSRLLVNFRTHSKSMHFHSC